MLHAASVTASATNALWVREHCKARTAQQSSSAYLVRLCLFIRGFFLPKKSYAEEHEKAGVRHASSSPCAAGEAQPEGSGPAPRAGAPKTPGKKKSCKKNPPKLPISFCIPIFHHQFPCTSATELPSFSKYHTIANAGFGGLCGQPREGGCPLLFHNHSNALEAESQPDLSTKNQLCFSCLVQVLYDLLKYQVVNQRSAIAHLYFMFNPRVVAYWQDIWNTRSLFGHRHRFNCVLANSTEELWKIKNRGTNVRKTCGITCLTMSDMVRLVK